MHRIHKLCKVTKHLYCPYCYDDIEIEKQLESHFINIHVATNQSALNAIDCINDINMTEQQNYNCDECDSLFDNNVDLQGNLTLHCVQVIEVTERRKHNFNSLKINEYGQIEDSELDEEDIYELTDNVVEEMLLHDDKEFPCDLFEGGKFCL